MNAVLPLPITARRVPASALLVCSSSEDLAALHVGLIARAFEIHCAAGYDEAMQALTAGPIDLAVVDLDLRDSDGLSLIGQLWLQRPELPVMTIGAAEQPNRREAALRAGVVAHLSWPLDPDQVAAAVDQARTDTRGRHNSFARWIMSTASSIGMLAAPDDDPDSFLDRALGALVERLAADRGTLFVRHIGPDAVRLVARAVRGIDRTLLRDLVPGEGVTGKVFASGHGQLILDQVTRQAGFEDCRPVARVTASMCVPMRRVGDVIGVINISSLDGHTLYTPRDLEALEFLATTVAEVLGFVEERAAQSTLKQQLESIERLALAGEMTAGITHEIKSPLTFVGANMGVLGEYLASAQPMLHLLRAARTAGELPPAIAAAYDQAEIDALLDDAAPLVRECTDGLDRCLAIVNDLRSMMLSDTVEAGAPVRLDGLIDQSLKLTRARVAKRGHLATALTPGIEVTGCAVQIVQVLVNLINNAADAVADRYGEHDSRSGEIKVETQLDGDSALITVTDNGIGMTGETLARAFNPLFTTKKLTGGTGLGLGMVRRIVQAHGGTIEMRSERDRGTSVHVVLPGGRANTGAKN